MLDRDATNLDISIGPWPSAGVCGYVREFDGSWSPLYRRKRCPCGAAWGDEAYAGTETHCPLCGREHDRRIDA